MKLRICMAVLSLLGAGIVPGVAHAKSDACCGDPLTCFCYKAENGDWLKGGLAKIPEKAQTKGLKFKERDLSAAALKDSKAEPAKK